MAFSTDGRLLAAGSADGSSHVWHATDYRPFGILESHAAPVNCVAFSPDGKTLASASDDKTVQLWAVG